MTETRSTYRVYAQQWLFDTRWPTEVEAKMHADKAYADRLADNEIKVSPDDLDGATWVLWTLRWSVLAELKYEPIAHAWADALAEDWELPAEAVRVVERNSRAEHELMQHGVLKVATG